MDIKLPRYNDDEVGVFHPFFEKTFREILLDNKDLISYEIIHHLKISGGTVPDFILRNRNTKKSVLICEIKRTKSDVQNSNFIQQVRGYADVLEEEGWERPFYLLTNLELTNLYKYRNKKTRTIHHLIEPSPISIGNFSDNNLNDFRSAHKESLKDILQLVFNEKNIEWKLGLSVLDRKLSGFFHDEDIWKDILSQGLRLYVEGSLAGRGIIEESDPKIDSLSDFNLKHFNWLKRPLSKSLSNKEDLFFACYQAGKTYMNGSDFASLIQDIIFDHADNKDRGTMISTDRELCYLLNFLAKNNTKSKLTRSDLILDPSAGVGNILTESMKVFDEIDASQIWANEIDYHFDECLNLRLSLEDSNSVSNKKFPKVTIMDIADFRKEDFMNVSVVISNPPFKRRANQENAEEIELLSQSIKQITGKDSKLNFGQAGLEFLHLEMTTSLLRNEGTFVTIFPTRPIYNPSNENKLLRRYLLNDFGLSMIIEYPHSSIFADVAKSTLILCGRKGNERSDIKFIQITKDIEDINFHELDDLLNTHKRTLTSKDAEIRDLKRADLMDSIDDGWSNIFHKENFHEIMSSYDINLERLSKSSQLKILKRGNGGVHGSSNIIFPKEKKITKTKIPSSWLILGVRRNLNLPIYINETSYSQRALLIPGHINIQEKNILEGFINDLLERETKGEVQYRRRKTTHETIENIRKCNIYEAGTIIVPRACRKKSLISTLESRSILSTNFLALMAENKEQTHLLLGWLNSIFGQVQLEEVSNNEDGVRKVETGNMKKILIPDFSKVPENISKKIYSEVKNLESLNFKKLEIRPLDIIWADYLVGEKKKDILHKLMKIFFKYIEKREP